LLACFSLAFALLDSCLLTLNAAFSTLITTAVTRALQSHPTHVELQRGAMVALWVVLSPGRSPAASPALPAAVAQVVAVLHANLARPPVLNLGLGLLGRLVSGNAAPPRAAARLALPLVAAILGADAAGAPRAAPSTLSSLLNLLRGLFSNWVLDPPGCTPDLLRIVPTLVAAVSPRARAHPSLLCAAVEALTPLAQHRLQVTVPRVNTGPSLPHNAHYRAVGAHRYQEEVDQAGPEVAEAAGPAAAAILALVCVALPLRGNAYPSLTWVLALAAHVTQAGYQPGGEVTQGMVTGVLGALRSPVAADVRAGLGWVETAVRGPGGGGLVPRVLPHVASLLRAHLTVAAWPLWTRVLEVVRALVEAGPGHRLEVCLQVEAVLVLLLEGQAKWCVPGRGSMVCADGWAWAWVGLGATDGTGGAGEVVRAGAWECGVC
jgi:hypothetical protein